MPVAGWRMRVFVLVVNAVVEVVVTVVGGFLFTATLLLLMLLLLLKLLLLLFDWANTAGLARATGLLVGLCVCVMNICGVGRCVGCGWRGGDGAGGDRVT